MKNSLALALVLSAALTVSACTPSPTSPTSSTPPPAPMTSSSPEAATPPTTPSPASSASASPTAEASVAEKSAQLIPLPGKTVPELSQVHQVEVITDAGKLLVEVYPEAAPNAAQRFLELVEVGFFDGTPISRVVKTPQPFVAQFGINPEMKEWKEKNFNDDPTLFSLERGTLCFAKAGPNTNSTQIFINLQQNNRLADPSYNFTVFGKVVDGMQAVDAFKSVGDPSMGLDQDLLWSDSSYLKSLPEKPTMITSMKLVKKP